MSAHPNELEPNDSLVYCIAGAAPERRDGVLLKAGDARNQPLELLSPLGLELFAERQADAYLEEGEAYRVDGGHGWTNMAIPQHHPRPFTAAELRAGARAEADRRRQEWALRRA